VLSEFRDRLVEAEAGRRVLDGILAAAGGKGLVKTAGRARTDFTHVLSSARELCWLELVAETLRSALNEIALAAPDWLRAVAVPESRAPSRKASSAAACADRATAPWRRPASSTSSPAPPSTSPASTPTSPAHPEPAPAPATSQHFAPPTT
jgi:hypothetical protein